jgi:hypothetical protein
VLVDETAPPSAPYSAPFSPGLFWSLIWVVKRGSEGNADHHAINDEQRNKRNVEKVVHLAPAHLMHQA